MVKKILIVSDSHSKSDNVKIAIDRETPDMLIHLGDIEDDPEKLRGWLDDAARQYNSKLDSGKSSAEEISLPVPAVFIKGNCDTYGSRDLKKKAVFELNHHRFYCTHGHTEGVNYGLQNLVYSAMENDCDIALYGHTHVSLDDSFEGYGDIGDGVRILNPGSISLPRDGKRSYMVMTFSEDEEYTVELKTL